MSPKVNWHDVHNNIVEKVTLYSRMDVNQRAMCFTMCILFIICDIFLEYSLVKSDIFWAMYNNQRELNQAYRIYAV